MKIIQSKNSNAMRKIITSRSTYVKGGDVTHM